MKVNRTALRAKASIALTHETEYESYKVRDFNAETEKWIAEEIDKGNPWAWCEVKVTAVYAGLRAEEYLGGCSYKSKRDFEKDGYYEDMVTTVIEELAKQLELTMGDHDLWDHAAESCLWCVAT